MRGSDARFRRIAQDRENSSAAGDAIASLTGDDLSAAPGTPRSSASAAILPSTSRIALRAQELAQTFAPRVCTAAQAAGISRFRPLRRITPTAFLERAFALPVPRC